MSKYCCNFFVYMPNGMMEFCELRKMYLLLSDPGISSVVVKRHNSNKVRCSLDSTCSMLE